MKRYRNAVNGLFVTKEYATAHPDTTVAETPRFKVPEGYVVVDDYVAVTAMMVCEKHGLTATANYLKAALEAKS